MIPVSLTIKGIYSYQKEQHIDFSRLMEGQLFGIFGTVGSGKSSILEAITYALYGDTERMNSKDNRSYNMMNLKSNELLIDFIFDNYDKSRYRFLVRGKRNSKTFEKVGTLERNAYKLVNNSWQPLESASGEAIIGLSYDNFKRTIIIPQGKFQEFLQLGDSDRTKMLKDIFQLEKYEFFYQTAALEKSNQEAIHLLNGELAVYSYISKELISENELKVKALQENLKTFQERLGAKENLFKEQEKIKQWHLELLNCEQLLKELREKEVFYNGLKQKIHDFEYCSIHFKELINKCDRYESELKQLESNTLQLSTELEDSSKSLVEDEKELNKWKEEFDKKEINRSRLEDYDIIVKVLNYQQELAKIIDRIPAGEKFLKDVFDNKNVLIDQLNEKRITLRIKKSSLPDLNILSDIKTWFVKYNHENEVLKKDNLTVENKRLELKALQKIVRDITDHTLFANDTINSLEEAKELIKYYQIKFNEEESEHRSLLTNYEVQVKLGEFSTTLQSGEPCLLCGSLHHPQILIAEDVQEHLNLSKEKLKEILNKRQSANNLSEQISLIIHQKNDLEAQLYKAEKELLETKDRIELLTKDFHWEGFSINDENRVLQFFKDAREIGVHIKNLELEEEKIQQEITESEIKYNKYKEVVDDLHKLANEKQTEVKTLKQQIRSEDSETLLKESKAFIEQKMNVLRLFIDEVDVNYEHFVTMINKEHQKQLVINERLKSNKERVELGKVLLLNTQIELDAQVAKTSFSGIVEISNILSHDFDLNQQKAELKKYEEQLYSCKENHKKVKDLLANKTFIQEEFDSLQNEILLLKEERQTINNEFIKTEAILVKQQKDHQRKLNIEEQLNKLLSRAENINVLKNLFKGSGFVSYISSVYLNQLCASANERFYKLSRQQLRLEVTDKNDFQVRDYLNDGRVRSVKTLSGGQTFQASLALALALAESVQQQNKAMQNFFFLDEGFGSLDRESLQIAFETLKSLRKENRLVGVISHVEELQQEIDVFLNVNNSPSEGSTVKGSWE